MPLDPVVAALFEQARKAGRLAFSAGSPEDARALVAAQTAALGAGPELPHVEDIAIPGRSGSIPARLYAPDLSPKGLVVYIHGGGWVIGRLADYDSAIRVMAVRSGCAILAIDYRLAPEHPFPSGLEDVCDALSWASNYGDELVPKITALVVAGDSAGANLAIGACDVTNGRLPVTAQVLIYPVTDTSASTASYVAFGKDFGLTRADMEWFFAHYAPPHLLDDERIAPLRRLDLRSAPRAWIATAEYDVLRDEGEAYARRLGEAGVPTTLHRAAGLPHGFIRLHSLVPSAGAELGAIAAWLREAAASKPGE